MKLGKKSFTWSTRETNRPPQTADYRTDGVINLWSKSWIHIACSLTW